MGKVWMCSVVECCVVLYSFLCVHNMSFHDELNDKLIEEVERRQALYMKNLKEYKDSNFKKKLWEEVCVKVLENWNDLSPQEKREAGRDVQKRWQNLRACFAREVRYQKDSKSGQASSKRRKYIYFDKLIFLLPNIKHRPTRSNVSGLQGESEDEAEQAVELNTTRNRTSTPKRPKTSPKKNRQKKDSYEESLLQILKQKSDYSQDEDTNFVLSLVPALRSLSYDEKLEAKIQILSVLKRVKSS